MACPRKIHGLWLLAGLLAGTGSLCGAPFEQPREGPVAFRRDLLPVDVETMTNLSEELVVLAQAQPQETPGDRRLTAQLLGLALGLNPMATGARETLAKLANGASPGKPDRREITRAKARVWRVIPWLDSTEAGADGKALALCLGDVIAMIEPDHPGAASILEKGERGAWKGWIPDLEAFKNADASSKGAAAAGNAKPPAPADPVPAPVPATQAKIQLAEATILTPMWVQGGTDLDTLTAVPLRMAATTVAGAPEPPIAIQLLSAACAYPVVAVNRDVNQALATRFGALPAGSKATLSLPQDINLVVGKNGGILAGPSAALLGAALSGHEPTGMVIGKIEADGSFKMGPDFWSRLRAISKGPGGRLVIPTEAADLLPSLLALEDAEFFLLYDVLLASNLQELLERTAKTPASPLAEQLSRFQDIRTKGATIAIGQYVTNRFVRQRLVELSNEAPYFASPRLLAVQAAGSRPTKLPKKLLASELKRALEPIAWIKGREATSMDVNQLEKSYEAARAKVDLVERYADSSERDLQLRVREMTTTLRSFARSSRVAANRDDGFQTMLSSCEAMMKSYTAIIAELDAAAGIAEPQPGAPEIE